MLQLTLPQWLDRILDQHTSSDNADAIRILPIAQSMNLVDFSCPCVIVAGTNGKGSVVRLIEEMCHGFKVGVYTSPHLFDFNERVRVSGAQICDADWVNAFECVSKNVSMRLSFFEYVTLAALFLFQQRDLDLLLLEVGLGGRLDPVNVVHADVSVITSLGMDHMEQLGNTLRSIALEKSGVFKAGAMAVCGAASPPSVIEQQARTIGVSDFSQIGQDYRYNSDIPDRLSQWHYTSNGVFGSGLGSYFPYPVLRLDHAATAIRVVELLGLPVSSQQISVAVESARLPGRFEEWDVPVPVIFDVAHNAQAVQYVSDRLNQRVSGKVLAIVAMRQEKCLDEVFRPLLSQVERWYAADLDEYNSSAVGHVYSTLTALAVEDCGYYKSVDAAVLNALNDFPLLDAEVILIFGSFHTVRQAQLTFKRLMEQEDGEQD